ncbi:MAG: VirB4-like conjugal transfer ATPase, CD1110 family [Lachnospiraceae bacterium]
MFWDLFDPIFELFDDKTSYVQDLIPVKEVFDDGIFRVDEKKYSKTFCFQDVNYVTLGEDEKEEVFMNYSALLNTFGAGCTAKITVCNYRLNKDSFENNILLPLAGNMLDEYRTEQNRILVKAIRDKNAISQNRYLTVTVEKENVDAAKVFFDRIETDLGEHFKRLGSSFRPITVSERLRILHDFYRTGEEDHFCYEPMQAQIHGYDFKDYFCPYSMELKKDHFKLGPRYGRMLYLRDYASYIKDEMVTELSAINQNLMLSIDIEPIPTEQAIKDAEKRLLGIETNITNWQRRQNQNNNYSATVPYELEQQQQEMKDFLNDLTTRDQKMMSGLLTIVHTADTKEQLDSDTDTLLAIARRYLCELSVLKYQQLQGMNTALPYGVRDIRTTRTLTTESMAVLMPFRTQEIQHKPGIYYGQNAISQRVIIADRRQLMNGNSFILGVSGSGKSFAAKGEISNIYLSSDSDVIIIDPEREYTKLVTALGGEVINISSTSKNHINAMDMNQNYGDDGNPIVLKSEFIMSLCEQLMDGTSLGAKEKSIIDRCTALTYMKYQTSNLVPTLKDFYNTLMEQEEVEAAEIALSLELFTNGSLNTFAKETNVDTNNRLICYDIFDLGKQLMPIGMLVVLDSILNRITQNKAKGKSTFIFIDEIYLLFQHEYSANFLFTLWKRVRKHNAFATGITQNVDDLLQSHTARTMLANSEFLIILKQAGTDREELAKLLHISKPLIEYLANAKAGQGVLKVGGSFISFVNNFPKNTKLYKLITTKPNE